MSPADAGMYVRLARLEASMIAFAERCVHFPMQFLAVLIAIAGFAIRALGPGAICITVNTESPLEVAH